MKNIKPKTNYDLFSKQISLYFQGSGYYSTLFGKIATIIYILLYVILLIYYSFLGILKKKGTFISKEEITKEIPKFNISKENLYFSYSLEHPETYDNFRDNQIYYTEAYYKHGKRVGENWIWEQKKLEVGPCEVEYFGEKYKNLLELKPYKKYTCIKNLNENLFGHFIYDDYSFIYIQIFPCVNDTIHNCKSQEIIDKYLNGTFIDFQVQTVLLDIDNYTDPVKEQFEDIYTTVGRGFKRELHIYFRIVNFEDYGFFGESLGPKKYLQYNNDQPMFTLNSDLEKNKSICDVTIKLSDKTLIIKREYNTLLDTFSRLGGIMDLILKIITIIVFFPVATLFDINVINELFQFDVKNKKPLYKGIKNKTLKEGITEHHKNNVSINSKAVLKNLQSIYGKKTNFDNNYKQPKLRISLTLNKKNTRQGFNNNFNSKDYILNNVSVNNPPISDNFFNVNSYNIINNGLNKKYNLKSKAKTISNRPLDEQKIIKVIKTNPFILCLFGLFPNKFTNESCSFFKMSLYKFREELDVTKLFRIGLLNNRSIEILKKNNSLLSFDKEDLVFNTDALYT